MADTTNRMETSESVSSLVGGILNDAQQLMRQEVALARREIHEEVNKAKTAAASVAVGGVTLFLGEISLCFAVVYLIYWLTNVTNEHFPLWACFAIVGAVLVAAGVALLYLARTKVQDINLVPPQTAETMRENVQWIRNQT
jgi:hypothetical protein